jgi:hypothetical protein
LFVTEITLTEARNASQHPSQPVGAEAAEWTSIGVSGFKKGDRVPPGGTFTYTWQTFGWPTTAGVWLYHDHSICEMENVRRARSASW